MSIKPYNLYLSPIGYVEKVDLSLINIDKLKTKINYLNNKQSASSFFFSFAYMYLSNAYANEWMNWTNSSKTIILLSKLKIFMYIWNKCINHNGNDIVLPSLAWFQVGNEHTAFGMRVTLGIFHQKRQQSHNKQGYQQQ